MQIAAVGAKAAAQVQNRPVIQALYVDKMFWGGILVHAGHYANGLIITDGTGQQYAYENGFLVGVSNLWTTEVINGVQYIKHTYPNGSSVYSTEFTQFVVL